VGDVGRALAAAPLAHARRRPPDGGAQGRLEVHLLDGAVGGRTRRRRVVSREAPAAVHAPAERRHAAVLPVVARAAVRVTIGADAYAPASPAPTAGAARERRVGFGLVAACAKVGGKLLAIVGKVAKSLKVAKVGLAAASLGGWALLTTWQFALLIVVSISFHEYGHCWAMRHLGMKTKGFYLLPFVGGAAVPDSDFPSESALAYV